MKGEFRLYNKVNCSCFDLIGKLEPDQTKSLGMLFAQSENALRVFLRMIFRNVPRYDKYVINCEPQNQAFSSRLDILIRLYLRNQPVEAITIEAKSVKVSNAATRAANQVTNYTGFNHLNGFNSITKVTLTRDTSVAQIGSVVSITWTQLVFAFLQYYKGHKKDEIIKEYVNYLMSIQGNMNYYEEEILAIPAGRSLNAILASGLYECPIVGRQYANSVQTLYIAFRKNRGEMDMLYKVKGIIEGVDLNDPSQINTINQMPGYSGIDIRIGQYKQTLPYSSNDHSLKRLFVIDFDNSIPLQNIVRPLKNNTARSYYHLKEFLQPINSNKKLVIVQKNVSINGNSLIIEPRNNQTIQLLDNNGRLIQSFVGCGNYTMTAGNTYKLTITYKSVVKCTIDVNYDNNRNLWTMYYNL